MKLMKENMICLIFLIANIEDKDDVDEREYDPASILQPCLMKMQVMIMMKMLAYVEDKDEVDEREYDVPHILDSYY